MNGNTNANLPANLQSLCPAPSVDLNEPGQRKLLARRIQEDIDRYCAEAYDDGPRSHLGASLIGKPCSRELWYTFRWVKHKKFDGRMQRLFNRGHREEARFIEWLRGIGFEVWEFEKTLWYHHESDSYFIDYSNMQLCRLDADSQACVDVSEDIKHLIEAKKRGIEFDKGKAQFRISAVSGHFGGSLDGISKTPIHYSINEQFLTEFKTHNDKSFTKLSKDGVKLAKPQHFAQMSAYGRKYGFRFGLYMAINKNNDEIYIEIVELDWKLGEQLELKAERVISSQTPPPKLAESPAFHECKYCDYCGVCHKQEMIDRNCRSCSKAVPVENGEWRCNLYDKIIPKASLGDCYNCWNDITSIPEVIAKDIQLTSFIQVN